MSAFTRVGKQILANGFHYADAADETAAECIVNALNQTRGHSGPRDIGVTFVGADDFPTPCNSIRRDGDDTTPPEARAA